MLTFQNLLTRRAAHDLKRPVLASLTGIDVDRLAALEKREREPWLSEAFAIAQVLRTGSITDLIEVVGVSTTSGYLSLSKRLEAVDIGLGGPRDLDLVRSARDVPLSMACRVAIKLGLPDPIELCVAPFWRQQWELALLRPANCPVCLVEAGAPHLATCAPSVMLWTALPANVQPARPRTKGDRFRGRTAHGLRRLREGAGMTQAEMAVRVGMSPAHYGLVERGAKPLTLENAKMLAMLFSVSEESIYA